MKNSGIEWIGEIPDGWELQPLRGHLIEIKESNDPIQTTQVLSLTNKLGVIPYEEKGEQGNKSKENYNEYKLAYPNTIVANSMNILIGSVGICNYFGCVSPVYYVFKPNNDEELKFLDYIFQSQPFQKELRRYAKGILEIRLRVSANDILRRQVAFPSLQQQKRIVDFLEAKLKQVDELIANQQGQLEKLKEYKQSVITEAVTKGLDKSAPLKDSGIDWIGEIPENWNVFQLKNISTIKTGHTPSTAHIENFNGNVNWYTPGDFVNETIENSSRKISEYALQNEGITLFPVNTTLLVGIGGTAGKVCRILVEGYSNQQITALMANDKVDPVYLFYELTASRRYLKDNAMYTTLPIINNGYLGSLKFVIPNIKTQKEIADYLDKKCGKIDRLIAIKQEKIEKLQEYKKSLIYEYVTGKKEVV